MTAKGLHHRFKLARALYTAGVLFLMVGLVLSLVSQPAKAQSEPFFPSSSQLNIGAPGLLQDEQSTPEVTEEVTEEVTQEPGDEVTPEPTEEPSEEPTEEITPDPSETPGGETTEEPGGEETPLPTEEVTEEPTLEVTETPTEVFTATPEPTDEIAADLPPGISGEVNFTQEDYSICQYVAGPLNATLDISLPDGVTGRLITEFRIVNPPNKRTGPQYKGYDVVDGDRITVEGYWPGVDSGDEVVEIHFGARLSYRSGGFDYELDTDGLDVYWYPWVCQATPTPTQPPLETLNLTWECGFEGTTVHTWRVNNPNNQTVNFSWQVEGGSESGSGSVEANGVAYFTTSLINPQNLVLTTLPTGETASQVAGSEFCYAKLTVGYSCTEDDQISYYVNNPNEETISYTTTVNGAPGSNGNLATGITTIAVTANGANQVVVNWEVSPFNGTETINTPIDTCVPDQPSEDLVLTYSCMGALMEWSVTNPNTFDVDFTWSALEGSSGIDTVPAGSSVAFYNAPNWAANTVTVDWVDINEDSRTVSESNEEDYCRSPETPETPTTTPPTETPTTSTPTTETPTTETPETPETPTPPSGTPPAQQTPVPDQPLATLAVPDAQGGEALLIPVTGADLSEGPLAKLQKLFIYLGMMCFGAAFLVQGSTRKRSE